MKILLAALVLGVAYARPTQFGEDFFGHHLIDVNITDVDHAHYINDLANVGNMGLDIWLYPTTKRTGRLRVPPESVELFMDLMKKSGVDAKIRHTNLKQLNDEVKAMPQSPAQYSNFIQGVVSHNAYYTFSQISSYLETFASYSGVSLSYLNERTAEGRQMAMISITGGTGTNKKKIFIEAGVHAREWISQASALYFIDRMLSLKNTDSEAANLFNNYDWYIVPVSNPDGYVYTHTTYRYWRKNRRAVSGCGSSRGVDLNRNFQAQWGGSGSSGSCSSDTYRGPSVWSEAESRNIRDAVANIQATQGTIHAYLSIHAFSQLLLTPYGYAPGTYPPNAGAINTITLDARAAIQSSDGRLYTVGSPADILYNADGSSSDWARLTADIQYAMTYELRPSSGGLSGFVLPTSQIAPCSKEVWDSIVVIAEEI